MEGVPLLCGQCRVRVEVSLERGGEPVARCLVCGRRDTLADAQREAELHRAHRLLSDMLRGADGQAKKPPLSFRFVEEGDDESGA